jgi:cytochrome b561
VLLIAVVVVLGWRLEYAPRASPARDLLLLVHRSLGLAILAVMLFRAGWRLAHKPPPLPADMAAVERLLAAATHLSLYLAAIVMPLSGWVNAAAAGHPVSLFGLVSIPPLLAEDGQLAQFAIAVHLLGQYALYLVVALHTAAALYHLAWRRDGVWQRMASLR